VCYPGPVQFWFSAAAQVALCCTLVCIDYRGKICTWSTRSNVDGVGTQRWHVRVHRQPLARISIASQGVDQTSAVSIEVPPCKPQVRVRRVARGGIVHFGQESRLFIKGAQEAETAGFLKHQKDALIRRQKGLPFFGHVSAWIMHYIYDQSRGIIWY
jgi:hypothetical protein